MREGSRVRTDDVRMEKVRKMVQSKAFSDLLSLVDDWDVISADKVDSSWNSDVAVRNDGLRAGKEYTVKKMAAFGAAPESAQRPKQFQKN